MNSAVSILLGFISCFAVCSQILAQSQIVATLTGLAQGDIGERNFNPSFRLNAGQKLKMTVSNSTDTVADLKFLYWDSLTVETIPEPGSYALVLGLAGSLLIARRR